MKIHLVMAVLFLATEVPLTAAHVVMDPMMVVDFVHPGMCIILQTALLVCLTFYTG